METQTCPQCGTPIVPGAAFCPQCGAKLFEQPAAPQQPEMQPQQPVYPVSEEKSKIAAGLLAIFLGTLGIHKFYLGYTKEGVIMLLVSIFGAIVLGLGPIVMGIIALIEGILYLTKSDADFYNTYVRNYKGWF